MSLETLGLFVALHTVLCLTPGPAVLLVLSQALGRGAPAGFWSTQGILAGNTIYFALSATSLGLVLASSDVFFAVKWLGAAYLIWLGLREIFAPARGLMVGAATGPALGRRRLVLNGMLLQLANPKALLYFGAVLPQFLSADRPLIGQVAILWAVATVIELAVLNTYSLLASRAGAFARQPRFIRFTNIAAGSLLVTAGAGIAALRR
jgi:homoserine/homoserine lactone efflux protein